jgi:hypothetical protein
MSIARALFGVDDLPSHAPPLADENLAVQQTLKRRVGTVRGIVHLDPFGTPVNSEAGCAP